MSRVRTEENLGAEDSGDAAQALAADLAPTKLPAVAAVTAILLPPLGAALGHLTVRRTYWRQGLSRLAIVGGWVLSVLYTCCGLLYLSYQDEAARTEAMALAEQQEHEQMRQAIAESPSTGQVDHGFCQTLLEVAESAPVTEFVTHEEQITAALVEGYGKLGQSETPNAQVYRDYAQYLVSFADHDVDEHVTHAEDLEEAVNDDVLACMPLLDVTLE